MNPFTKRPARRGRTGFLFAAIGALTLPAVPVAAQNLVFAGLTDVQTLISVHDTHADVERIYQNPQRTPFQPVQDTDAFATCP
jgi:hypothetical protein